MVVGIGHTRAHTDTLSARAIVLHIHECEMRNDWNRDRNTVT